VDAEIASEAIERAPPDYPPLFTSADTAATRGERRAIRMAQLDIAIVLAGASITVAATLVTRQPYNAILATGAAVAFLLLWAEKSFSGRLSLPRDWFESRAVAEAAKSLMWRYMMQAAPFEAADGDGRFLTALRDSLASHDEPELGPASRVDGRQITPYMRLVRALPPLERRGCYLTLRLSDQMDYYSSKSKRDARAGKRWRTAGLVFRGATFGLAVARFRYDSAGVLVGLFVTLTVVVASWSQLIRYDDLAKGYRQVSVALRKLDHALQHAEDEQSIEKLVLEAEGIISQEQTAWMLKRS
jgi:hypothetical protein